MDLQLDQLRALSWAVAEGSFEGAAGQLRVTPSAISQRIKALESSVGRVLLQRSRPVQPTESGHAVLRLARQLDLLVAETARELGEPDVDGAPDVSGAPAAPVSIPLVVNADSLATWVLPAFTTLPPGVVLDIHREDQGYSTRLLADGTAMAAITSSAEPVQGCHSTRLGTMRYRAVASPGFATAWFSDGVTTRTLQAAPMVVFDRKDDLQDRFVRRKARRDLRPPRHHVPASADFVAAIRLGLGWGMVPDQQNGPTGDGPTGDLVDLDPGGFIDIPLFWQQWKLRTRVLDAIADAVRSAATASLRQP